MADNPVKRNWLVDPSKEVEAGWLEIQIQEKKSQIARNKQDVEDMKKGKIKALEMTGLMLDAELKKLDADLLRIRSMSAEEINEG